MGAADRQQHSPSASVKAKLAAARRAFDALPGDRQAELLEQLQSQERPTLTDSLLAAMTEAERGGMTAYALAKAAGVTQASVRRFRSGEKSLSLPTAEKLATALGLVLVKVPEFEP